MLDPAPEVAEYQRQMTALARDGLDARAEARERFARGEDVLPAEMGILYVSPGHEVRRSPNDGRPIIVPVDADAAPGRRARGQARGSRMPVRRQTRLPGRTMGAAEVGRRGDSVSPRRSVAGWPPHDPSPVPSLVNAVSVIILLIVGAYLLYALALALTGHGDITGGWLQNAH